MDINQLSYDLAAYRAGAIRMNNMRVIPSRAPFTDQRFPQFTSSYESFSEEELIRLRNTEHIDYGIFSKKIPSLSINPIFESDHIIVYDLHTLSPVQAVTKQKTAN
jgi:hypothetical protein